MPLCHGMSHDDLTLSVYARHQWFLAQRLFLDDLHDLRRREVEGWNGTRLVWQSIVTILALILSQLSVNRRPSLLRSFTRAILFVSDHLAKLLRMQNDFDSAFPWAFSLPPNLLRALTLRLRLEDSGCSFLHAVKLSYRPGICPFVCRKFSVVFVRGKNNRNINMFT